MHRRIFTVILLVYVLWINESFPEVSNEIIQGVEVGFDNDSHKHWPRWPQPWLPQTMTTKDLSYQRCREFGNFLKVRRYFFHVFIDVAVMIYLVAVMV